MASKRDQIMQYIEDLDIGTRISVRKIAQEMNVSKGTAYRAIKEAEAKELVRTIPRAGTIRVEKSSFNNTDVNSNEQMLVSQSINDIGLANFIRTENTNGVEFSGYFDSTLSGQVVTTCHSALTMLMSTAGVIAMGKYMKPDIVIDSFTVHFFHPTNIGDKIDILVQSIEKGKSYNKVEINVMTNKEVTAKALLSAKHVENKRG